MKRSLALAAALALALASTTAAAMILSDRADPQVAIAAYVLL